MRVEKRTDAKVGATVIVSLLILLAGIAWAKGCHFGASRQTARAVFPTAGGLEAGDPVTVNGVKRGVVNAVDLRQSDVMVTMEFTEPVDLRRDAQATIMMFELMGGKKVEVMTGASSEKLASGVIAGSYSGDIGTLVAMVSELSGTLRSIIGKADTLFASLNALLGDGKLGDDVKLTMADARRTLQTINVTANDLRAVLSQNREPLNRTLLHADKTIGELSEIMSENRPGLRSLIDSSKFVMSDARFSLARANALMASFDTIVRSANTENTFLWKLTRDKSFADKFDSTMMAVIKLSEQIRYQGLDANIRFFNSSKPVR